MSPLPAAIESVSTRADHTVKVVIGTQELDAERAGQLLSLSHKLGWFQFSENKDNLPSSPKEEAPEFRVKKSLSQRLHSVLFVYWKECTKQSIDFEAFYEMWMEKKISEIKEQLPKQ